MACRINKTAMLANNFAENISGSEDFNPELLINALDASVMSLLLTDNRLPDNPIVYCNKTFEKVTGYSMEEVIGLNCRFLQGKQRDIDKALAIRHALAAGENITIQIRNFRKDGSAFSNELHISPVKDFTGVITHFIGVQLDVSEKPISELSSSRYIKERDKRLKGLLQALKSLLPNFRS